ncbi:hypothetical protein RHGRI_013709 [Rhododendron griersonianum]|uniref:Uncharacterized protein n=1 Tax=Rhododendron griersonianum TaxID=479676 RepID=A0AAV6K735_9ERIC|nr:hypothetical protein RHGRI_013709 [Rhododendron griersonianum]
MNCNATLKLRRVAIHGGDIGHYLSLNQQTSHVRAMLYFLREIQWNRRVTKSLLWDSKFLRVLRIEDDDIQGQFFFLLSQSNQSSCSLVEDSHGERGLGIHSELEFAALKILVIDIFKELFD